MPLNAQCLAALGGLHLTGNRFQLRDFTRLYVGFIEIEIDGLLAEGFAVLRPSAAICCGRRNSFGRNRVLISNTRIEIAWTIAPDQPGSRARQGRGMLHVFSATDGEGSKRQAKRQCVIYVLDGSY